MQEEDVIGVLNSTDIAQLLPLGDRILVEVCSLLPFASSQSNFLIVKSKLLVLHLCCWQLTTMLNPT